jgi:TRAP-type C4-dicarboxylate transport system permease small subunit
MAIMAHWLRLALEILGGALLVLLTALVTYAATIRLLGFGLAWYDEVAPIILTWITFFGAALVTLHRGHLGFDNVVRRLPVQMQTVAFVAAECLTLAFFLALAWGGFRLLSVISGERLMTLAWFPSVVAQCVIPVASIAFIAAELLTLPQAWAKLTVSSQTPETASHLS